MTDSLIATTTILSAIATHAMTRINATETRSAGQMTPSQQSIEANAVKREASKMNSRNSSIGLAPYIPSQSTRFSNALTYRSLSKSIHSKKTRRKMASRMRKTMTRMDIWVFINPPT